MYYLIIDEKQVGPVPFEQLTTYGIGPDTMVWKEGMPQWAPASTLQELTPLFNTGAPFSGNPYGQPQQPCQQPWQQPYQQQQQPWQQPYSGNSYGQAADNEPRPGDPGYTPNLGGCQQPQQQPQQQFQQQPQQQPWQQPQQPTQPTWEQPQQQQQQQPWQQPQQPQQPWQQPGQPGQPWQSWQPQSNYERKSQYMTLAIIGTVLGIFSCLGLIFGIIAITKANSANKFYAMGDEVTAASNDSSARTFSIIALVLDGLGILISLIALGS